MRIRFGRFWLHGSSCDLPALLSRQIVATEAPRKSEIESIAAPPIVSSIFKLPIAFAVPLFSISSPQENCASLPLFHGCAHGCFRRILITPGPERDWHLAGSPRARLAVKAVEHHRRRHQAERCKKHLRVSR